jgi:chromate transporter
MDRTAGVGGRHDLTSGAEDRPSLAEVFGASLRLGLTSFGGPVAHIAYFRREYVERRGWLDEARFADLLALSQALPGPASSQLGIAIGTLRAGRLGGIVSWLGFTLPSAIILVAFALLTASADLTDAGWVRGLKLAAVAVVAQAVLVMWRTLAPDAARSIVVVTAALVALVVASPAIQVAIIGVGALVGFGLLPDVSGGAAAAGPRRLSGPRWAIACLVAFAILLVGLPLLREAVANQAIALFGAFYRAGSLVFGGGHVVLPLLNETVVVSGWVSEDRFLAGYGAAQAVPGPLFTFAGFLGASMTIPPTGVPGALIALVAIFLPSFLLVWGLLPFWDALRGRNDVRRALTGVNAAVVGLLLAALITPVWTSAVVGPLDAFIAAGAALLLVGLRFPPWAVVLITAAATEVLTRLT